MGEVHKTREIFRKGGHNGYTILKNLLLPCIVMYDIATDLGLQAGGW